MNIFVSDFDPMEAAVALDDKRVIKMILESAQLLSTAMSLVGLNGPYRITHKNHPCSIWVRTNDSNFLWLTEHFFYLCEEYEYRFNKVHKCAQYYNLFNKSSTFFDISDRMTNFPNCTEFKDIKETTRAYRAALNKKWQNDKREPKWTKRKPPMWAAFKRGV